MIDARSEKWLTIGRLSELLSTLPANNRVMTNAVGNLNIVSAYNKRYLGFIDFLGGDVELMEEVAGEG